MSMEEMLH